MLDNSRERAFSKGAPWTPRIGRPASMTNGVGE
jgi:hypothetical protein